MATHTEVVGHMATHMVTHMITPTHMEPTTTYNPIPILTVARVDHS